MKAAPSRAASVRWLRANAERFAAVAAAVQERPLTIGAVLRVRQAYTAMAVAWRLNERRSDLPQWVKHAAIVAAEEFERRANVEARRVRQMRWKEMPVSSEGQKFWHVPELVCTVGEGSDADYMDSEHGLWLDIQPCPVDIRVAPGEEAQAARFLRQLSEQAGRMADVIELNRQGVRVAAE